MIYVTSYELSKEITKVLGNRATYFAWFKRQKTKEVVLSNLAAEIHDDGKLYTYECPAFDIESLLLILPASINKEGKEYTFLLKRDRCFYRHFKDNGGTITLLYQIKEGDEPLAEVVGRMLLQLKEEKYIR